MHCPAEIEFLKFPAEILHFFFPLKVSLLNFLAVYSSMLIPSGQVHRIPSDQCSSPQARCIASSGNRTPPNYVGSGGRDVSRVVWG